MSAPKWYDPKETCCGEEYCTCPSWKHPMNQGKSLMDIAGMPPHEFEAWKAEVHVWKKQHPDWDRR